MLLNEDISGIRTGIVGLGNIGQFHAERLRDIGVDLVGGMDIAEKARETFGHRYGVEVFDDHQALYETVDALIITTPNKYHEQYAVDALEMNRHVLIEKPIAHTVESAERVASAARMTDAVCMVGFNNRFANIVRIVKDRIDRGTIGNVTHIEANYVRRRGIPGRGTWFTNRAIAGGGALIDLGVHAIDLALFMLDYPKVAEVTGITRTEFGTREEYAYLEMWGDDSSADPRQFDVDDSVSGFVRTAENRSISLEVAWATNRPANHEFVVHGTDAAARFDLLENDLSVHSASTAGTDHLEDTTIETVQNDTHRDEQIAFFDAITNDRHSNESIEQALSVQRVIDGLYRSSDLGETVAVSDSDTA